VLGTIQAQAGRHPGEDAERGRELIAQLQRLRDLYVMGDLTKPQYAMRRQVMDEELQRAKPPTDPTWTVRKPSSKTSRASGTPSPSQPSDAS
jgi:hypothetical protein